MRSFIRLAMAVAVVSTLSFQALAAYMFDAPISIAIDNAGNLIVSEPGRYRVDKYDNVLNRLWRSPSLAPLRLAIDSHGNVYVADNNAGVKKLDAATGQFVPLGAPLSQVTNAVAVAIDGSDYIYVLDRRGLMQKFTPDGSQQLGSWGGTVGSGDGEFSNPTDIAVGYAGKNIYIADSGNHRIQRWQLTTDVTTNKVTGATFVGWLGRCNNLGRSCNLKQHASRGFSCTAKTCSPPSPGSGAGQFIYPSGLAVAAPDYVYVADFGNSRIQKFDANGTFLTKFGTNGIGPGQLIEPTDVAADSAGNVWASDGPAGRLVEFDANGNPLRIFGGREILAASPGSPPLNVDPIFDPRAVPVFSGHSAVSTVTLATYGYSGVLNMTSPCCLDLATSAPVSPNGVSAMVSPTSSNFAPPQAPATANLTLSASSNPTPGKFITQVTVADPAQNFSDSVNVGFEVLPPWPGDGAPPACMPALQVLPLSMLDLFAWRQPMTTTPSVSTSGVAIKSTDPHCVMPGSAPGTMGSCAGFELDLTGAPGFSPNLTMITFKNNTHSGFVNVTSSNSANCAASTTFTIPAGATLPLLFAKATTTTLIFSDASGHTPVAKAQFSEGPFWTFFGGRNATITFIGDWRF